MDAQTLFKAGKLTEAVSALTAYLRDNPMDLKSRTFLFELLCFTGDFERAEKQLNIVEQEGNKDSKLGTLLYIGALHAERTRQEMFQTKTFPQPTGKPAGPLRGKLNGKEFESLQDADPRIGEKLEVFAAGDYLWISFRDIASVKIEEPKKLRDLFWAQARLTTGPSFRSRELGEILLPAIAPLSWQHEDDLVRLGRVTEFCEDETGVTAPYGGKTLLVDGEEIALLDVRDLEIYPVLAFSHA